VKSPNADTASTAAFNLANDKTPQRRTFPTPTTEGDQRHLYGQGKAMPKDSSGSGANWGTGIQSDDPNGVLNPMNSRLDFDGTVTATDLDRATDTREKGRIGILGSALAYAGSSPRVTSEKIGRDINPLGRGGGAALVGGQLNLGRMFPSLPISRAIGGTGSSVNNRGCAGGCGGGTLLLINPGDPFNGGDEGEILLHGYEPLPKSKEVEEDEEDEREQYELGLQDAILNRDISAGEAAAFCAHLPDSACATVNNNCAFPMPSAYALCIWCNSSKHGKKDIMLCFDAALACDVECWVQAFGIPSGKCRDLIEDLAAGRIPPTDPDLAKCIKEAGGKWPPKIPAECLYCCFQNWLACTYYVDQQWCLAGDELVEWECPDELPKDPKSGKGDHGAEEPLSDQHISDNILYAVSERWP